MACKSRVYYHYYFNIVVLCRSRNGSGGLPSNLSFMVDGSSLVADLIMDPYACLLADGEQTNCFDKIRQSCLKLNMADPAPQNPTPNSCIVDLARGIIEVCSRLGYDNDTSTCINSFLQYTKTVTNDTIYYTEIFNTALRSYLRNCLKSNVTNKVACVMDSITRCLKQRKQDGISVSMCFKFPFSACLMINNLERDDCNFYIENTVRIYSRDFCADNIDLCVRLSNITCIL